MYTLYDIVSFFLNTDHLFSNHVLKSMPETDIIGMNQSKLGNFSVVMACQNDSTS